MTNEHPVRSAMVRWLARCAACWGVVLGLLLTGCGGGADVAGGVGSGGTGLATVVPTGLTLGTVSGFGSIIVDGTAYDDSQAIAFVTDSEGAKQPSTLKLGQQIRVLFAGGNVSQSLQILPQLAGPVTMRPDADGWMQVMGQWVRLVAVAGGASRSNVTILSGYASSAVIDTTKDVEVHGSWVYDKGKSGYVLWATRLEKLPAGLDPVQVGGVIQGLGTSTFKLSAASSVSIRPAKLGTDLANGQVVRVWMTRAALARAAQKPPEVDALRVERVTPTIAEIAALKNVRVSGLAGNFDPVTSTVEVQGLRVEVPVGAATGLGSALSIGPVAQSLSSALLIGPVEPSSPLAGQFVGLDLAAKADGVVALSASERTADGSSLGGTVDISGSVTGIDWTAAIVSFTLRGVDVRASRDAIESSCPAVANLSQIRVRVLGRLTSGAGVLAAIRLTCG